MTIEFASLGSGSGGNATLIRGGGALVLVDCGFSLREMTLRAAKLGICLTEVNALLVTHEHSDHIKGMPAMARKFNTPVFMTAGTHLSRSFGIIPNLTYINNYQSFQVRDLNIQPIPVPHDAADPVQYTFSYAGLRVGVLTDLGSFSPRITNAFSGCHGLLLEANHDIDMLARGPYPQFLKQRVGGAWGHLNNQQAKQLFVSLDNSQLECLALAHISQTNNCSMRVAEVFAKCIPHKCQMHVATQDQGLGWFKVTGNNSNIRQLTDTF